MRIELRGLHTVVIGDWHESRPGSRSFHPARQDAALAWLRGYLADRANCVALRALLEHQGVAVAWLEDHDVAAEVAARLVTGQLAILEAAPEVRDVEPSEAPASPEAPPAPPPPQPPPARREPVREPEPVAEPATFEPSIQDEQAEILERAAAEGTPFCEECERLRQQEAAGT
jgi:hypothetical protein